MSTDLGNFEKTNFPIGQVRQIEHVWLFDFANEKLIFQTFHINVSFKILLRTNCSIINISDMFFYNNIQFYL